MATIKQKQTAANKILRISKKNNNGSCEDIYIKPCIDDNNNQYVVCDYMAIKTTEEIYPIEECNQLYDHNISFLENIFNIDLKKYKKINVDIKELKAEKKWLKENNGGSKQIIYDFHNYGALTPLVNIDYLTTMLTIVDNGSVYISNKLDAIYIINDNSIGVVMPIREAKNSNLAEIFAKRDKEFKYGK